MYHVDNKSEVSTEFFVFDHVHAVHKYIQPVGVHRLLYFFSAFNCNRLQHRVFYIGRQQGRMF